MDGRDTFNSERGQVARNLAKLPAKEVKALLFDQWPAIRKRVGLTSDVEVDRAKLDALIKELGSEEFVARERAQAELSKLPPQFLAHLRQAEKETRNPETKSRLQVLIAQIKLEREEKRLESLKLVLVIFSESSDPEMLPLLKEALTWIPPESRVWPAGRGGKGSRPPDFPVSHLISSLQQIGPPALGFLNEMRADPDNVNLSLHIDNAIARIEGRPPQPIPPTPVTRSRAPAR